ncbi:MAG: hypothetical protein IKM76_03120 [Prevotella sp.]|jgi:hypothetical protein|nr:hypothetical protein [Prevotella sp.]
MKYYVYLTVLAAMLLTASCHRNYKVVHARVPVDTLAHDDIERVEQPSIDEPIIDIPEAPQENDFEKVTNRDLQEYNNYMRGQGE